MNKEIYMHRIYAIGECYLFLCYLTVNQNIYSVLQHVIVQISLTYETGIIYQVLRDLARIIWIYEIKFVSGVALQVCVIASFLSFIAWLWRNGPQVGFIVPRNLYDRSNLRHISGNWKNLISGTGINSRSNLLRGTTSRTFKIFSVLI